ncbi:LysM peptidoglycan-binding domain-containing protein [Paenibacillus zeisoli]|uniref:LysM peptidoglycan-binding domain-containing protein n=1 Tax=Paenibacillus zeisoli TaxID=2496267 RepID=UPI00163C9BDE|nr:LysM peptidoglycan-binding domain-containing protein [Paenibacillus zeisoli]
MADQSYGLRFDIYERVHLSEEVIGIQELVELELLPRIQVVPGDEYASLRGHLHVSGLYRGEEGTQELSHLIPVEITVPLSRVNRLEDITVEIENFDVDVLNPHSLNITGVLSLRGIETVAFVPGTEEWSNEEYSVSHETEREEQAESLEVYADQKDSLDVREEEFTPLSAKYDPPSTESYWSLPEIQEQSEPSPWNREKDTAAVSAPVSSFSPLWADKESKQDTGLIGTSDDARASSEEQQPGEDQLDKQQSKELKLNEPELNESKQSELKHSEQKHNESQHLEAHPKEPQPKEPKHNDSKPIELQHNESPSSESSTVWQIEQPAQAQVQLEEGDRVYTAEEYLENVQELEAAEPALEPHVEDRPELKIALGSKKLTDHAVDDHVPLSTLLQSGRPPREPEALETLVQEAQTQEPLTEDKEDARWKNLFISGVQEQTPFRQVKLVIVQREETIDVIADRYQINPRELLLYNRLSEQSLEEGQILYIP